MITESIFVVENLNFYSYCCVSIQIEHQHLLAKHRNYYTMIILHPPPPLRHDDADDATFIIINYYFAGN